MCVCVCVCSLFSLLPLTVSRGEKKVGGGGRVTARHFPTLHLPPSFPLYPCEGLERAQKKKKKRNDDRTPRARDTMPRPARYQPFLDASFVCGFKRQQRDFNEELKFLSRGVILAIGGRFL